MLRKMSGFFMLIGLAAAVFGASFVSDPRLVDRGGGQWTVDFAVDEAVDVTLDLLDSASGRVVRRLGAGMLGANAPLPFAAGSLTQSVAWDGRDDAGVAVPAPSALAVRGRLGMRMGFSRYVRKADYPPYYRFDVVGLAVDSSRNLYAMFVKPMNKSRWTGHLAVYSPQGKYLRTLVPFPANADPSDLGGVTMMDTSGGRITPALHHRLCQALVPGLAAAQHMTMDISSQGMIAMAGGWATTDAGGAFYERNLVILNTDGTVPRAKMAAPNLNGSGFLHFAFTPAGDSLYIAGMGRLNMWYDETTNNDYCVYKMGLGITDSPRVVLGEKGVKGSDNLHFGAPRGLALDGSRNIYVSDMDNRRVQVFSPQGAYVGGLTLTEYPAALKVHPVTGSIYIMTWDTLSESWYLNKYSGYDGARTARYGIGTYSGSSMNSCFAMALDPYGDSAVVYLGARNDLAPFCVLRCVDTGSGFACAKVEDLRNTGLPGQLTLMCSDPENDKVFLGEFRGQWNPGVSWVYHGQENRFDSWWANYRASTVLPNKVVRGRDGLFYMPSSATPAYPGTPNTVGKIQRKNEAGTIVNFSGTGAWSASIDTMAERFFNKDPIFITRDGRIAGLRYHRNINDSVGVSILGPDGNLMRENIIEKMPAAVCLRLDSRGNYYFADNLKPPGALVPPELAGLPFLGQNPAPLSTEGVFGYVFANAYGSILKFDTSGGRIRRLATGENPGAGETLLTELRSNRVAVSGMKGMFFGASVVPPSKFTWSTCNCMHVMFDIDLYDRIFVPDAVRHCVHVLDANFNRIATFGGYDNFDGPGGPAAYPRPEIPMELPMEVAATDRAVYVANYGSRYFNEYTHTTGIVRAVMDYEVEYLSKDVAAVLQAPHAGPASAGMAIYPNPSHAGAVIRVHDRLGRASVTVFDVSGKKVQDLDFSRRTSAAVAPGLPSGIYLARLTVNGRMIKTARFLVAK